MTAAFLRPYLLTVGVEAAGMLALAALARRPWRRPLLAALLVNAAVYPAFYHGFRLLPGPWPVNLYLGEALVVAAEAALYRVALPAPARTALLLALALNAASVAAGAVLLGR